MRHGIAHVPGLRVVQKPPERERLCDLPPINHEVWRVDLNLFAGQPGQPLDVERIMADIRIINLVRAEHDDVAALGPGEVITDLVNEYMVAEPDAAGCYDLAL